jgi:hypothetical protein
MELYIYILPKENEVLENFDALKILIAFYVVHLL